MIVTKYFYADHTLSTHMHTLTIALCLMMMNISIKNEMDVIVNQTSARGLKYCEQKQNSAMNHFQFSLLTFLFAKSIS